MDDSTPRDPRPIGAARQEEVRRLLAAARHQAPPPADVADRLDASLADLVTERAAGRPGTGPGVVPLRRRRWSTGLLAAAAVAVIGLGATQVISGTGSSEDAVSAGDGAAMEQADRPEDGVENDAGGDEAERPTASLDDEKDRSGTPQPATEPDNADALEDIGLLVLNRATLARDLRELAADLPARPRRNARRGERFAYTPQSGDLGPAGRLAGCGPADPPDDTVLLTARFRGDPAVVSVTSPWAGYRVAEVYPCPPASPSRAPAYSVLLLPR